MPAADQRTPGARWTPFFFLLPFLFFLLLFWVIPLIGGVQMSLHANGLGQEEYVGFAHYKALANDERYVTALRNSFVYTLASVVVIVPLALWLAYLLRESFRRLRPVLTFALLLLAAAVVLIVGDIVRFLRPELERYFERARAIVRGEGEL